MYPRCKTADTPQTGKANALSASRLTANGSSQLPSRLGWLHRPAGLAFRWLRWQCAMRSMRTSFDAGCGSSTWCSPRERRPSCRSSWRRSLAGWVPLPRPRSLRRSLPRSRSKSAAPWCACTTGRVGAASDGAASAARMIGLPAGTRVWLVAGHTDMRKGFDGLAAVVQTTLAANPFCGHVFAFRGRRGDILKVLWFDGQGLLLLAKRLERGRFVWPRQRDAVGPVIGIRWDKVACWRATSKAMEKLVDARRRVTRLQLSIEARHLTFRICAGDAQMQPATPRAPILTKNHSSLKTESGES
jgi:transposase